MRGIKTHIRKCLTRKKGSKGGIEEQTRHIDNIKMANVNLTGSIISKYEWSKNSNQNVEVSRPDKKASSNNAVNKRYRFKDTNSLKVKAMPCAQ